MTELNGATLEANANTTVTWTTGEHPQWVESSTTSGYCQITPYTYSDYYYHWYPSYPAIVHDRTEKAFKIVKMLMDKKMVKNLTIKKFIDLVGEITEVL